MKIFEDYFGSPYPYAKLDLVAVPNFSAGAMENAGLVTFREELLLVDDKGSAKSRRDMAMIMAHELAHMWFGNLVTMNWWDDLWLNEGFATYAEAMIVDMWKPDMRAGLELLSWQGWVMGLDALESARAVRNPVANTYEAQDAFDGITYVKGASVIKMIHRWLGEDVFKSSVQSYLRSHAWGNATATDLFAALSENVEQDVAAVASTFLDQGGVPLVRAQLSCPRGAKPKVSLTQQRYRGRQSAASAPETRWRIPVCVQWDAGRACRLMEDSTATLELDAKRCPKWLLPNAGYDGYYRYALAPKDLDKLGKASLKLGAIEKIGFITNLWALVQAGQAPAKVLLDALATYSKDRDRAVSEEVTAALHNIADALIEEGAQPKFDKLVTRWLLPRAKQLGFDARAKDSEDDRLQRMDLLKSLAVLSSDPWLIREAETRAKAWLKSSSDVDADSAPIALRIAARSGAIGFKDLLGALMRSQEATQRTAVVSAMGSLKDPASLRKTFAAISDGTIRVQDALYVARAAMDWPDSRRALIAWMDSDLAVVAKKSPGFGVARMIGAVGRLCDRSARDAANDSFAPKMKALLGSDRRLREALEKADLCIDLRSRQAPAVSAYLESKRL